MEKKNNNIKERENFAKRSNPISVVIRIVASFRKLNTNNFIVIKQVREKLMNKVSDCAKF